MIQERKAKEEAERAKKGPLPQKSDPVKAKAFESKTKIESKPSESVSDKPTVGPKKFTVPV